MLLLCSCEKEIRFTGRYEGEKLVLYAIANPDTLLCVDLHRSKFILDSSSVSVLDPLRGATVTGRAGGREIVFHQENTKSGLYVSDYSPSVSETIELYASYGGFEDVRARTVVPKPADFSIDSYSLKPIETDKTARVHYRICFSVTLRDNPDERNFYRISILRKQVGGWMAEVPHSNDDIFQGYRSGIDAIVDYFEGKTDVSLSGIIDDRAFDGRNCQFEIWIEDYLVTEESPLSGGSDGNGLDPLTASFDPSRYAVEIDTASEDLFMYSQSVASYNRYEDFNGLFGEPVSIFNNVTGGIGCFGALTPCIIPLMSK